jgi:hypothetical protein
MARKQLGVAPSATTDAATKTYVDTGFQPLDSDLTTLAGLTATTDNFVQAKSSAWASRTLAQVKTDLASVKGEDTRRPDYLAAIGGSFSPMQVASNSASPTSQSVSGVAVYLYANETVTNVLCGVVTAGAGTAPTALKLGVWSSAATPACLSVTSDLASDSRWTTQGWKVNALSSAYVVPTSGIYYLVFWINGTFATTNVSLATTAAGGYAGAPIGSNPRMFGSLKTSATTMAVSDTGTYAAAGGIPVLGWS